MCVKLFLATQKPTCDIRVSSSESTEVHPPAQARTSAFLFNTLSLHLDTTSTPILPLKSSPYLVFRSSLFRSHLHSIHSHLLHFRIHPSSSKTSQSTLNSGYLQNAQGDKDLQYADFQQADIRQYSSPTLAASTPPITP
jgi:hypothetical protein